nr:MAG TPA: hypothetical protein [Caudoviricetes sp.]
MFFKLLPYYPLRCRYFSVYLGALNSVKMLQTYRIF